MTRFLEFARRPRASRLRAAASKSGKQDTRLAAQVTAVSVVTAESCPLNQGWPRSERWRARYQPTHATTWLRKTSKRASPGAQPASPEGPESGSVEDSGWNLATESDGCQWLRSGDTLPGVDKGDLCDRSQVRNAGMISLAKSRICFSNKSGVSSLNRRTSRKDRARCSRPLCRKSSIV